MMACLSVTLDGEPAAACLDLQQEPVASTMYVRQRGVYFKIVCIAVALAGIALLGLGI